MQIDDLIDKLQAVRKAEGNIEVTCTACLRPDGDGTAGEPFESTVENFKVHKMPGVGKVVRLYL